MPLTLTNPTLSTTFDSTEVDANFSDLQSKFNAGVGNADLTPSAGIPLSKLAATYQEVWCQLVYVNGAQGAWPATGATTPLALCPLPGSDSDTPWVVTDISWVCTDTGTVAGSFDVRYGAYDAGGNWVNAGSLVASKAMTVAAANTGNQGRALEGGSTSLTQSTTIRHLALMSAGAGTAVLDGAVTDQLIVTIALRRQIQA